MSTTLPRARKVGLMTRKLRDELLVYDLDRHKASCLNRTAALVWQHCDGRATFATVIRKLRAEMDADVDERAVWLALERLEQARLLDDDIRERVAGHGSSRREWLRDLGRIGVRAALLPAVVTIVAPTVADAQSVITPGVCAARTQPNCGGTLCKNGRTCQPFGATGCKCQ
jgi:hypothetical protein